jgi:uncharacterized protein
MADQGSFPTYEPLSARSSDRTQRRADAQRVFGVMLLYIGVVFIVAAVLAPSTYNAVQRFAPGSYLADQPFHRYVNRLILFLALLGLWPLLKELRLDFKMSELGLRRAHLPDLAVGFLWGFGIIALVTALAVGFGARTPNLSHSGAEWLKHLRNAFAAALLAGCIEEFIFRGALFSGLRRNDSFFSAALVSSLIYGIVHFFERPANPEYVQWNSGLMILSQMLRGFFNWQALIPGLLNLTLIGIILCLAFDRTKSLLFSIGLHGGLIFWLKSSSFLTSRSREADSWIWGGDKLVDGWITSALLMILLVLISRSVRRARS